MQKQSGKREHTGKELADAVCQTKKDGLIDDFVYKAINAGYLSAILRAL